MNRRPRRWQEHTAEDIDYSRFRDRDDVLDHIALMSPAELHLLMAMTPPMHVLRTACERRLRTLDTNDSKKRNASWERRLAERGWRKTA
jgi:hypothetical protein